MVNFFPPNIWQMLTFLNPLNALIPKIPFSLFPYFWARVTSKAWGSDSVEFWGSCQLSPFWGKGGVQPEGSIDPPPPPGNENPASLPFRPLSGSVASHLHSALNHRALPLPTAPQPPKGLVPDELMHLHLPTAAGPPRTTTGSSALTDARGGGGRACTLILPEPGTPRTASN